MSRLDVKVTGIRNNSGTIRVAVCDQPNFPNGQCPYRTLAPAQAGEVTVTLPNIPSGIWAVAAYHDEANRNRLDLNWLGFPKQGIGFSRDARINFGPPKFPDAAFTLNASGGVVTVPLHYPS